MADGNYDIANLSSGDSTDDEDCPKKSVSYCLSFVCFCFVSIYTCTCTWPYAVFSVCVLPLSLSVFLYLIFSLSFKKRFRNGPHLRLCSRSWGNRRRTWSPKGSVLTASFPPNSCCASPTSPGYSRRKGDGSSNGAAPPTGCHLYLKNLDSPMTLSEIRALSMYTIFASI